MNEIWKDIAGWEGRYKVSNLGRVLSYNRPNGHKDAIVVPHPNEKGYLMVHLYRKPVSKTVKVHKLVAEAFIPNPAHLPEVNHIDGDKSNNRVDNLEWMTRKANVEHARKTGAMDGVLKALGDYRETTKIPVIATNKATGEETAYESINAAARGCETAAIRVLQCIRGERKSSKGFSFRKGGIE